VSSNGGAASPEREVAPHHFGAGKPTLVFFYSATSGRCRRVDGYLAQTLQRRQNHDTFALIRVDVEERPRLAEHFRVEELPTLVVVEGRRVVRRVVSPRGSRHLERELGSWLR
jgi:thioredoxin 1